MSENDETQPPHSGGANPFASILPQRSVGLKLLLVCGLALLMAIPALFVYSVVAERTYGARTALEDVSMRAGGEQKVLGPVLALPYARVLDPDNPRKIVYGLVTSSAETGSVNVLIDVEERKRGIYRVPVFEADLNFTAQFDPAALRAAIPPDARPIWTDARLYVGISDNRGVKDAILVTANGQSISMEPAPYVQPDQNSYQPVPRSGLSLASGDLGEMLMADTPINVTARMKFTGAQTFSMGPFAKDTSMTMASNWDHPSFTGGVLPDAHDVSDDSIIGFNANWRVPYLARNIPGSSSQLAVDAALQHGYRDMSVRFMQETNPYQSVERALKYAAMFIGFVFLAYFLFEITSQARAHPAQYVLVGLAQAIFYLLLLALAERLGFDPAFLIAATMTVLLTSGYAMSVFGSRAYGLRALVVLTGIYGLVYVLMRAEGQALLAGALASFTAIALTMWMTRDIDWYGMKKPD